jgi:uncharacterized protein (DUF885 family)
MTPLTPATDDDAVRTAMGAVTADYWDTYLETHPLFATTVGDARFDDRLPDPTPEGTAASLVRYAALRHRVEALEVESLDPLSLTAEDRVTLSALGESLAADVAELETGLLDWNLDPTDGVPAEFLLVPDFQRLATVDDGRRMVARWREMAVYTDRLAESMHRSLLDGRVACRVPADRVVEILTALLGTGSEDWPLLAPLATVTSLHGWTTADRERFAADLLAVVNDQIRPAFARFHDALVTEILPATRPAERPGMCHVPGGADGYRRLVRMHTSLDVDAETLHQVGLDEIARIDAELSELAARTIGTSTLEAALARLRTDPSLCFATRDEVYAKAAASLARATEAIPAWFGRLPQAPCEVVRMGQHEEAHSTIAYYRQSAADGSRPGQYFINTSQPTTRPRYEAEALAYHEATPGHHLQTAIGQELPHLPEFRRHLGPTAYFEGWGLYTERLADEMGLYTGDLDRIGVLSFDAWRAARLVVDTGMHAMGWPREQAVRFMLEHTALAPNNIANEVDRYIVLPGQALGYKVGQLEILRLRAEAQARLGAAFDIRSFHDVVLGGGALALPTLRGVVEAWTTGRLLDA